MIWGGFTTPIFGNTHKQPSQQMGLPGLDMTLLIQEVNPGIWQLEKTVRDGNFFIGQQIIHLFIGFSPKWMVYNGKSY